ncbi:MAG TPA: acyl-CoA dehydrogenase family protein [Dehalococcoidia bacterium]|nr:acyl-CoA dehydrogenase family protein [Dehalococcoidia bacterium]
MVVQAFPESIQALLPRIRERREEIEEARQVPADLAEALGATGIYRLLLPKDLGGTGVDHPADAFRAIELVSAADGSTGWCAMLGIGSGHVAGQMRPDGARDVFADPDRPKALVAEPAGVAVRTADGVRISGRWRFASGITHSDWVVVGAVVMQDGAPVMTPHGPDIVHGFIPRDAVTVHDTWHVSGLCGTGSHDVSCQDADVPAARVLSLFNPEPPRPDLLYRLPVLAGVAPSISAVALGIARAALDELQEMAPSKTPTLSQSPLREKPVAQAEIARAEAALGGARAFMYDALDDLWQTVACGQEPALRQQALLRAACVQATETAASVTRTASTLAGSTSVYRASSLQRHARDADVITHHFTQAPHVWEDAGRALLGLQPHAFLF